MTNEDLILLLTSTIRDLKAREKEYAAEGNLQVAASRAYAATIVEHILSAVRSANERPWNIRRGESPYSNLGGQ